MKFKITDDRRIELIIYPKDVQWIVNDRGELGVKVGEQCFFLYKGCSLAYDGPEQVELNKRDPNEPFLYRSVGKREFGESCITLWKDRPELITESMNRQGDDWRQLPPKPKWEGDN